MNSNNLKRYVDEFFDELELYDDVHNNHRYKKLLKEHVDVFLNRQTTELAYEIYKTFFMIYQIRKEDKSENEIYSDDENTLLNLVEIMKKYEENTGELIDKQRDHFLHSVNVFLLGLAIYSQNENYRNYFKSYVYDSAYKKFYRFDDDEISDEEFLYRWGIASLFHDIGYPVEIIGKQMKKFINDGVKSINSSYNINTAIDFKNFNEFNTIVKNNPDFADDFRNNHDKAKFLDLFKPTDIMAYKIYDDLKEDNLNLGELSHHLNEFVNIMGDSGFIDHGFFSSILVLNSYGFLIQKYEKSYEFFFYPIVDSATAILLHNYFRNVLLESEKSKHPQFNASSLSPENSPIAFLLILCDELQEWNRRPWGVEDKKRNHVDDLIVNITNESLYVKYLVFSGEMGSSFLTEKKTLLDEVLQIKMVFKKGLDIKTNIEHDNYASMKEITYNEVKPQTSLLQTIEKLPEEIYSYYAEQYHSTIRFDDLDELEKYSNIRQAKSITKNLSMIGCDIVPKEDKRKEYKPTPNEIADLAMFEHKDWCKEKWEMGWNYGPERDNDRLIHPLLVEWEELPEKIRNDNIKSIENILIHLSKMGLKTVINNIRILTIEYHNYYNKTFEPDGKPFEELSDEEKYFNYKQTKHLLEFLNEQGYDIVSENIEGQTIDGFSKNELECLARREHEKWCDTRVNQGWKYGEEKDEEKQTNPNLVPWENLKEDMREFNRNTYKNINKVCSDEHVGLKIIKKEPLKIYNI